MIKNCYACWLVDKKKTAWKAGEMLNMKHVKFHMFKQYLQKFLTMSSSPNKITHQPCCIDIQPVTHT